MDENELPKRIYRVILRRQQYYEIEVIACRTSEAAKLAHINWHESENHDNISHSEWDCISAMIVDPEPTLPNEEASSSPSE